MPAKQTPRRRWALPSAHDALVKGARRVIKFFADKPHHVIPFEPSARELRLGAQLEQSLLSPPPAAKTRGPGRLSTVPLQGRLELGRRW